MIRYLIGCTVLFFPGILLFAQQTPSTYFGNVTAASFKKPVSAIIDADAGAVILSDSGHTSLEGVESGISVTHTRFTRVLILNKNGFKTATVIIRLPGGNGGGIQIKKLQATTYNLENGKVVSVAADNNEIFTDKINSRRTEKRFTCPAVREGSIIEYSYTITSGSFFRLIPWYFQREFPCLRSVYAVSIPGVFDYAVTFRGSQQVNQKTIDSIPEKVWVGSTPYETKIYSTKWVMNDVPALHTEPFTFAIDNYLSSVSFQASQVPRGIVENVNFFATWQSACDKLLSFQDFGSELTLNNGWLKKDMEGIVAGSTGILEKSKKIFAYVRDHFTVDGRGIFMSANSLKDVFRTRRGNVADINLLLIAMLRYENITADPIILSTRDNGLTNAGYPILEKFNYVIARISIDGNIYYLDASSPALGFGKLPLECYNGAARLVSIASYPVFLSPDSLHETTLTSAFIYNDDKDKLAVNYTLTPTYFQSQELRNEVSKERITDFFKKINKPIASDITVDSVSLDNIENYEKPVSLHLNLHLNTSNEDIIYFNPMLNGGILKNPFVSAERSYPVEMPYAIDEIFTLNMEIPKGYKIEELPKSTKIRLNENDGYFEYAFSVDEDQIRLRSRILLRKAIFPPEDYQALRDFYSFIVKKHAEMIVFRKTK